MENKNNQDLNKYTYLITTQISNPGSGFVGTAYSDGRGNMFCETMHKPEVCNHRDLSQIKEDITPWADCFIIDDYQLASLKGKFLSYSNIIDIKEHFLDKRGYFEFVKGKQKGNTGIYTTGYEPLENEMSFPERWHREGQFSDLGLRINAIIRERY